MPYFQITGYLEDAFTKFRNIPIQTLVNKLSGIVRSSESKQGKESIAKGIRSFTTLLTLLHSAVIKEGDGANMALRQFSDSTSAIHDQLQNEGEIASTVPSVKSIIDELSVKPTNEDSDSGIYGLQSGPKHNYQASFRFLVQDFAAKKQQPFELTNLKEVDGAFVLYLAKNLYKDDSDIQAMSSSKMKTEFKNQLIERLNADKRVNSLELYIPKIEGQINGTKVLVISNQPPYFRITLLDPVAYDAQEIIDRADQRKDAEVHGAGSSVKKYKKVLEFTFDPQNKKSNLEYLSMTTGRDITGAVNFGTVKVKDKDGEHDDGGGGFALTKAIYEDFVTKASLTPTATAAGLTIQNFNAILDSEFNNSHIAKALGATA